MYIHGVIRLPTDPDHQKEPAGTKPDPSGFEQAPWSSALSVNVSPVAASFIDKYEHIPAMLRAYGGEDTVRSRPCCPTQMAEHSLQQNRTDLMLYTGHPVWHQHLVVPCSGPTLSANDGSVRYSLG